MNKNDIGARIQNKRKKLGFTQKELAEKIHVTDKTVSKWETGRHFPDIEIMEDLAMALGISLQELLGLENDSAEETIASVIHISKEEKKTIIREIRNRGFLTVILGIILFIASIYTSKILADNNIFGLPQITTVGMAGFIGIIIVNGFVSICKGKRLLKDN